MKTLLTILTVFFTVMFSSSSFAGWTKVGENAIGTSYYIELERVRKVDGYVYFWYLHDRSKPTRHGDLSTKIYNKGDCKLFRYKNLSYSFHKEPMGVGTGEVINKPDKEWGYPSPNSSMEGILKAVCSR